MMFNSSEDPSNHLANPKLYEFCEVLEQEQAFLKNREAAGDSSGTQSVDQENFSICFSGGGIRSAAFNLGVLQALAEKRLLPKIDYLSTVSGGGYIGSWFMALLHRNENLEEVQKLLKPKIVFDEKDRTSPTKDGQAQASVEQGEPQAIHHLRTHSNYLAPKVGIFSTDLWALWVIYLRNTFLNALVLGPLMLAITFLLRYFRFFQTTIGNEFNLPAIQSIIGIGCTLLASLLIFTSLSRCRQGAKNTRNTNLEIQFLDSFWLPVLLFAVSTAFIGSAVRFYKDADFDDSQPSQSPSKYLNPEEFSTYAPWVFLAGALFQAIAFNHRSFLTLFRKLVDFKNNRLNREQPLRWIFSGMLSGGTLAILLYSLAVYFPLLSDEESQKTRDTFSKSKPSAQKVDSPLDPKTESKSSSLAKITDSQDPGDDWWISLLVGCLIPLALFSFSLAQSFQIGILGSLENREVREKWSFLQAYCSVAGLGWLVAFVLGVVVPDWIYGQLRSEKYYLTSSLGAVWGTTSGIAIWLAQSLWTGTKRKPILDAIVKLGPYVALALGFVVVGLVAKFIVHDLLGSWISLFNGHLVIFFFLGSLLISLIASRYVDVNIFSLQEMYENRLVSAFLGASQRERTHIDPVTHIDPNDDLKLCDVGFDSHGNLRGPIHLINTAINLCGTDQREYDERKADSFVLSPLFCGSTQTGFRRTDDGYAGELTLGRAFSTSGAAVSPNMGYYSTAPVTALLTFCNLRLGGWFPNPRSRHFKESNPKFGWIQIVREIMGFTDAKEDFVYLSDGGHFDNLGAYELVRRRTKKIYICDAGADPKSTCHELAMLIRNARIDFSVAIDIDVSKLARNQETGLSEKQIAFGKIFYPANGVQSQETGEIIYLKLNLTKEDSTDLLSYQIRNPDFPHQSTVNQFYSESQFESYRYLGYSVAQRGFSMRPVG
jgi:hypothetical protein